MTSRRMRGEGRGREEMKQDTGKALQDLVIRKSVECFVVYSRFKILDLNKVA